MAESHFEEEKMDRNYYVNIYEKYYDECMERAKEELEGDAHPDPDIVLETATEIFEDTANAEQVAGYYIVYHQEDALKDWKVNTEGKVLSEMDREVDRILNALYA